MAWHDTDWSHRVYISIDATLVDEATDYIPVFLSKGDTTFWSNVQADGDDIRFTEDDGETELAHYLAGTFTDSGTTGTACYLVDVSGIISASSNVSFFIYTGNGSASAYGVSDTYGRNNVFDANTVAFYLPGETTTDLTGGGYDLTAVNTPGTAASAFEGITAADYDSSSSQYHYVNSAAISDWPLTLQCWVDFDAFGSARCPIGIGKETSGAVSYAYGYITATWACYLEGDTGGAYSSAAVAGTETVDTLYSFALTRDANTGTTTLYRDTTTDTDTTTLTTPSFSRMGLAAAPDDTPAYYFDGQISVAGFHDVERSANYISTNYNAWTDSGFLTWGETEDYQSTATDYRTGTAAGGASADVAWSDASNASSDLVSYASATLPQNQVTQELNFTNFDFSDLSGRTIDGVEVIVYATGEDSTGMAITSYDVQLIKGGTVSGTDKADGYLWGDASIEAYTYGGASDLWGLSLTDSDVGASNFGVSLQFFEDDTNDADVRVYTVMMRIYHSAGGGGGVSSNGNFFKLLGG